MGSKQAQRLEAVRRAVRQWSSSARITAITRLTGGMSADIFRVECDSQVVVARFPSEWIRNNISNASHYEFATLQSVQSIPSPQPLFFNEELWLMSFVEGTSSANPKDREKYLSEFASVLSTINQLEAPEFLLSTKDHVTPRPSLNHNLREPEIVQHLMNHGPIQLGKVTLRHGDYWPGNVLWRNEEIVAVIDWENALRGPAIADLSISRLDIAWAFGFDAMDNFTEKYLNTNSISVEHLPYWDLRISLRPMSNLAAWPAPWHAIGRPDITVSSMQETLLEFIERSLQSGYW